MHSARSRIRRSDLFVVVLGVVATAVSMALPWSSAGSRSIAGHRVPRAVSLLADAGFTSRWLIVLWSIVPAAAIVAWLAMWSMRSPAIVYAIAGCAGAAACVALGARIGWTAGVVTALGGTAAIGAAGFVQWVRRGRGEGVAA